MQLHINLILDLRHWSIFNLNTKTNQSNYFNHHLLHTLLGNVPSFCRTKGSDSVLPTRFFLNKSNGCPLLFLTVGLVIEILGKLPSPAISNVRVLPLAWLGDSPSMTASNNALKLCKKIQNTFKG
jgi:hypothetical protein